jgi:hypothetical protein
MLFSVDFPHAYPTCNGKESETIEWTGPAPFCGGGGTSLALTSTNPPADSGVGTVSAVITVKDVNGNRLSDVSFTLSTTDRTNNFVFTGTSNGVGQNSFVIPNDDYGAHDDPIQVVVGTSPNQCTVYYNDLTWSAG